MVMRGFGSSKAMLGSNASTIALVLVSERWSLGEIYLFIVFAMFQVAAIVSGFRL